MMTPKQAQTRPEAFVETGLDSQELERSVNGEGPGSKNGARIVFMHTWPWSHPAHRELAKRLGAFFELPMGPRGIGGLPTALKHVFRMSRSDEWDALLCEGPCVEVMMLRALDRRRRRLVRLDSTNSCIRLSSRGLVGRWLRRLEMRQWDSVIVLNERAEEAARRIMGGRGEVVRWTPAVTSDNDFEGVVSDQKGPVVALMTGGFAYRAHYKGLDRVAAVSKVGVEEGWGPVRVFGGWSPVERRPFEGDVDFSDFVTARQALNGASILLHPSRNDAFPLAVVESMLAGVPPVVGEAGSATLVKAVEPRLVVEDEHQAVTAVKWLRGLPETDYLSLCEELRVAALRYCRWSRTPHAAQPVLRALSG
jgi:glycosyltransferase involved in cell wall biosynthesis